MPLITLFAREEPTCDPVVRDYGPRGAKDTVFYTDEACTKVYARWSWAVRCRPVRRRAVTLNCYRWALSWVPLATGA